jgi:hypothetical protein
MQRPAVFHNHILCLQIGLPCFNQHLLIAINLFPRQLVLAVVSELQLRGEESKADVKTHRQATLFP